MKLKINLLLCLILVFGFTLRVYGINWDQNFHLHPDERFLTMVGNAIKLPSSALNYFTPQSSTLNPYNNNFPFFVYGMLPLTITKIISIALNKDNYNDFTLLGRFFSALADTIIIVFIYKITSFFSNKYKLHPSLKFFAAFLYAIAVLPIQLSHFFTTDTFLNMFMIGSLYFIIIYSEQRNIWYFISSAIFLGCAFACKVTAIFLLPVVLLYIHFSFKRFFHVKFFPLFLIVILYLVIAYISVRITDPYMFDSSNFFNPKINHLFQNNLQMLKSFEGKDTSYPPAIQWISKSPIHGIINLAFFGVGLPYFFFVVFGICLIVTKLRKTQLMTLTLWVFLFFVYQSLQFVQVMRYFIFLYPFFAIFAAIGLGTFLQKKSLFIKLLIIAIILIWPVSFLSIYTRAHSRIQASQWIYANLPNNSVILSELWDDGLPLYVSHTYGKSFHGEQLPIFDQDTPEKWGKINNLLTRGDYYILSSNRAWGSISTVPWKYPLMSKFYADLFAGKTNYKKIKEFTSYPSLTYLGIPLTFPDNWAEENFTVFDHPQVMIFEKM